MIIKVKGIDMRVGEQLEQKITNKLSKFVRFFGDDAVMDVKLRPEKEAIRVELTLHVGKHFYRAEVTAPEAMQALESAVDIMEGQIRKHKTRIKKTKTGSAYMKEYLDQTADLPEESEEELKIFRRKSFHISPMDAEEAVLQMELLGHNFHIFLSPDTNKVQLVYKRKDGQYGLIEPEY